MQREFPITSRKHLQQFLPTFGHLQLIKVSCFTHTADIEEGLRMLIGLEPRASRRLTASNKQKKKKCSQARCCLCFEVCLRGAWRQLPTPAKPTIKAKGGKAPFFPPLQSSMCITAIISLQSMVQILKESRSS